MTRRTLLLCPLAAWSLLTPSLAATAQAPPPNVASRMVWRSIGPFRGGRVSAVSGVVGQPNVYYMGLPMGGVWKTTSAGATWFPIFDSVGEVSSVGAIQVAPSNPNVIYVGTGDMVIGGSIARGSGIYKSTDAGKTWRHIGLEGTDHIPCILVDPRDPNLVMAAVLGPDNKKSGMRGLYRSTDGGATWQKTLDVNDETGVQRIAWAYDEPDVMLATTVQFYHEPGAFPRFGPGRPGPSQTKVFKSTDEGKTWTELKGGGLPPLAGKTCVAIVMNTHAQRMFLVQNSGLWRSDDGGVTWRQMDASDQRVRNGQGGYNCGVYVDSQNPDIVYVVDTCLYRSTDGGETFTGFKGAPGGDDPQQLWIDPTDGHRILLGSDQGATITLDGGQTWSSWYNQPTGQIYHMTVDNRFPYWVYGSQQDSGSIATASRGNLGEVTPLDWLPHPGAEFGTIAVDPLNPKVSYAGGMGAGFIKTTYPSGQWVDVSPAMDAALGLRKVIQQPLIFSRTNPHELFAGFQYLMSTTDGGIHWRKLSPDLTLQPGQSPPAAGASRPVRTVRPSGRPAGGPGARPGAPAPPSRARPGGRRSGAPAGPQAGPPAQPQFFRAFSAIECISPSSVDGNVVWVGTNNGIIQVTRDHGATWRNVSIPRIPGGARADISSIDSSHQDAATAYAAVDCHGMGDYKPYLYRTHDFGRTWTLIVNGLPIHQVSGSFARVVRADTAQPGLLFAGTESSVYVSFDDGNEWQQLGADLPNTSFRDMEVKGDDLVACTFGRGFWILDDISPLRQMDQFNSTGPAYLFQPPIAIRVRRNVNDDTPFPPEVPHAANPPTGVCLYYWLGSKPSGPVTITLTDEHGKVVQRLSSVPAPKLDEPPPPVPDFWVQPPLALSAEPGLNCTHWNLRYAAPPALRHRYEINANPENTPASPEGPLVLPGFYTATLSVDGRTYSQKATVKNDPRSPATPADLRRQHVIQMKLYDCARQAMEGYQRVAEARASIAASLKGKPPAAVATAAHVLDGKLEAVGGAGDMGGFFFFRFRGGPPPQPTFAMIDMMVGRQLNELDTGDMTPTDAMREACASACADLQKTSKTWDALRTKDLPAFNALLVKNNLKPLGGIAVAAIR